MVLLHARVEDRDDLAGAVVAGHPDLVGVDQRDALGQRQRNGDILVHGGDDTPETGEHLQGLGAGLDGHHGQAPTELTRHPVTHPAKVLAHRRLRGAEGLALALPVNWRGEQPSGTNGLLSRTITHGSPNGRLTCSSSATAGLGRTAAAGQRNH